MYNTRPITTEDIKSIKRFIIYVHLLSVVRVGAATEKFYMIFASRAIKSEFSTTSSFYMSRDVIMEEALRIGYLQYDPAVDHRMFGALFIL
jgi:hypothetical protein